MRRLGCPRGKIGWVAMLIDFAALPQGYFDRVVGGVTHCWHPDPIDAPSLRFALTEQVTWPLGCRASRRNQHERSADDRHKREIPISPRGHRGFFPWRLSDTDPQQVTKPARQVAIRNPYMAHLDQVSKSGRRLLGGLLLGSKRKMPLGRPCARLWLPGSAAGTIVLALRHLGIAQADDIIAETHRTGSLT